MPSTPAERKALAVIAAIAALGVVARVVKSKHARPAPTAAEVLALDQQIARVREARTGSRSGGARAKAVHRSAPDDSGPATSGQRPATRRQPLSRPKREVVPVDLDTASAATIEGLPWVGIALAARIVESRERCGPFGSMEELTRVYGIGEGMAKRLAPHVTFSTPSRPMDADRTPECPGPAKGAAPRRRGRS